MPKTNDSLHDFHFVIDLQLQKQLMTQQVFPGTKSLSGIVVKILQQLYPCLEKEHFSRSQRYSRYELVTPNMTVERCKVHAYLPPDLYRRLKLLRRVC